jgi:hypothetical protein
MALTKLRAHAINHYLPQKLDGGINWQLRALSSMQCKTEPAATDHSCRRVTNLSERIIAVVLLHT